MANVKITELVELAAVDLADNDVLPIVDVGSDATKKVTIVSLRSFASANDYVTFTSLSANINAVQSNVNSAEANIIAYAAAANSNLSATYIAVNANINAVQSNVDAAEANIIAYAAAANANLLATYISLSSNINAAEANIIAYADVSNANLSATYFAALANDYLTVTFLSGELANTNTYLTTNYATLLLLDTVQDNVDAAEANIAYLETRRSDNTFYTYNTHSVVSTANIIPSTNNILSLGAPNAVYKDVYVGPGTIYIGTVRLSDTDGALTITSADDSSSTVDTQTSNVTAALNTVQDNVSSNYTQITANLNVVQNNVAAGVTEATAVETRRAANIAGAVSTITTGNLTASKALVSDESGKIAASSVTTVTLGYLDATSSVQSQIDAKAPLASPTFSGLVTAGHDLVVTGNLTVNGETTTINSENKVIQDRFIMLANAVTGSPSGDVGIFLNRGTSGNAAIYYDESAKSFTLSETRDPDTNVTIHPTGAANLVVGAFSASTISFNGVDLNTAITDNVASLTTATTAVETRRAANVTIQDTATTAVETRRAANVTLQDTATTAVEARRTANIAGAISTITTGNLTASKALVSDGSGKVAASSVTSTVLGYLDATSSVQTQLNTKISTTAANANDFITYTQLTANINLVQDNVVTASGGAGAVETRRVANIAGAVSTITTGNLTASKALVSDGSGKVAASTITTTVLGYLDATSSVQTQIDSKIATTDSASNDYITYTAALANDYVTYTALDTATTAVETRRAANVTIQDTATTAVETRRAANVTLQDTATTAVEARRTANIAGAISTITTGNLTASKALVSDGSGKVAASSVTSTVLGYLDATSSVQTQIDSKIATTDSASNDYITYTAALANDYVTYTALDTATTAVETRRAANVTIQDTATTAVETRRAANVTLQDTATTAVEARRTANIAGAISTITTGNLTASKALVSDGSGKVAASSVTSTVLGYLDATSSVQTQLNTKISTTAANANDFITYTQLTANINLVQDNVVTASGGATAVEARRVANIAGAVSTITTGNLTVDRALVSDGSGKVAASTITTTVLGYLDATSSVQTQLNSKIATTDSASNDYITYTAALANDYVTYTALDTATTAVETRRAANVTIQDTATTAVETRRAANVTIQDTATTAVETRRAANVTIQDTATTAVETRRAANVTIQDTATTAVEARRAANIAGAISTVTTGNLSTARALVSDESGKIAASSVTTVTLGYLDATSSIQNQLNTKAPLADPTFTGLVTASHDLVVSGNLTVNGETTTINSANKVIQDRFIMLANAVSGAPSGDVGIFLNRGTSGNAAIYYDESAKSFTLSETRDPDTNVTIHPTGAANLVVGAFSASTISFNGVDLNTAITDNVASLATATTAVETRRAANIAGAVSTITTGNLTASRALVSDGAGKVAASTITTTILGYLDATSSVQTQLNSKIATTDSASNDYITYTALNSADTALEARRTANIAGAVSTITTGNLTVTASKALVSDGSGKVAVSTVTTTVLGYLDATSSVQTQLNSKQATITGAATTIDTENLTVSRALVSDGSGKVAVSAVTATEVGYLDGVSSAIQTQLNSKQATITGGATTIDTENLTVSRALVSDASGKVAVSAVTATEVGYLDGVSSAIQTQIDSKQASLAGATLDLGVLS
jgi:hypothetical protein